MDLFIFLKCCSNCVKLTELQDWKENVNAVSSRVSTHHNNCEVISLCGLDGWMGDAGTCAHGCTDIMNWGSAENSLTLGGSVVALGHLVWKAQTLNPTLLA